MPEKMRPSPPPNKARFTAAVVAGGAVPLFVGLLVWFQAGRATRIASQTLTTVRSERDDLSARIQRAEARLAAIPRESPPAPKTATTAEGATPPAAPSPAPRPTTMSELIANYPDLEALELKRQRSVITPEYRELFSLLKLSPEQIQQFEDIKMKRTEDYMDLRTAERTQGEAGKQAVATLQKRSEEEFVAGLVRVLGAEGYQKFMEFDRTIPLRNLVVRGFAGATALEGIPITPQQGEGLMQALIAAGGADVSGPRQDFAGIDWAAVDAQAREILTPAQFAFFTSVAPATSFSTRWAAQLKGAIRQAKQSEAAAGK
jgi:hypothetical protein